MSEITEKKHVYQIKVIIILIAGLVLFKLTHAFSITDTTYIIFKNDSVHQKIVYGSELRKPKCLDNKVLFNIKTFNYENRFASNVDSNLVNYKFSFTHTTFYDTLQYSNYIIKKQKKEIKKLYSTYKNLSKKNSPCALEIKERIHRLELHLSSKKIVNLAKFVSSHKNIFYLKDLQTLEQADEIEKKILNDVIYIIDLSPEEREKVVMYKVIAVPIQPIRSKNLKF